MPRPKSTDRCVSMSISIPMSTISRLARLASVTQRAEDPSIFARNLLLAVLDAEEKRLGLPSLVPSAPSAPVPLWAPGSAQDYARPLPPPPAAFQAPPAPPAAPPVRAPTLPPALPPEPEVLMPPPFLPPPVVIQEFFAPPPGMTSDEVFDRLLPRVGS